MFYKNQHTYLQKLLMAGIYIHIPFCKQACNYCNFHFSTQQKNIEPLIKSICREAVLRKDYIAETIDTIYFGGGTPSILDINFIDDILQTIYKNYSVNENAEITIEANPDDITIEKVKTWKKLGINRCSLGVQSFEAEELQWMNRSHNASEAKNSIEIIAKEFENYSIDLIFGSQLLTTENWIKNIETALQFNPPHISCYGLTVEEKTKLGVDVLKNVINNIDDKKQAEQFEILMKMLANAGFVHYEISNYAKPNFESKHNSSYWQGKNYIGLGPSAHSYNNIERSWNIANNSLYISSIEQNNLNAEIEVLTSQQKFNEYVMIGIRTIAGIDVEFIKEKFYTFYTKDFLAKIESLSKQEFIIESKNKITLTTKGKLYADAIAVELFA